MPQRHSVVIGVSGVAGALALAFLLKLVLRGSKSRGSKADHAAKTARTPSRQGTRFIASAAQAPSRGPAGTSTTKKPRHLESPKPGSPSPTPLTSREAAAAAPNPAKPTDHTTSSAGPAGPKRKPKRRLAKLCEPPQSGPLNEQQPTAARVGPSNLSQVDSKQFSAPVPNAELVSNAADQSTVHRSSSPRAEAASQEKSPISLSDGSSKRRVANSKRRVAKENQPQPEQQQSDSALSPPASAADGGSPKPGAVAAIAAEVVAARTAQPGRGLNASSSLATDLPDGASLGLQDNAPQATGAAAAASTSMTGSSTALHPAMEADMPRQSPAAAAVHPSTNTQDSSMPASVRLPSCAAVPAATTSSNLSVVSSPPAETEEGGTLAMMDAAPSAQQVAAEASTKQGESEGSDIRQSPAVPVQAATGNQVEGAKAPTDVAAPQAVGDTAAAAQAAATAVEGDVQAEAVPAAPAVTVTGGHVEDGEVAASAEVKKAGPEAQETQVQLTDGTDTPAEVINAGANLAAAEACTASSPPSATKAAVVEPVAAPDAAARAVPDTPPKRVSLAPAVQAAEEARQRARSSSSTSGSRLGGSGSSRSSSSSGGSKKMTVADIIRESIKLKKSNQRLKQQLNIQPDHNDSSFRSGNGSSSSRNVPVSKAAAAGPSTAHSPSDAVAGAAASLDAADTNQLDQAASAPKKPAAAQATDAGGDTTVDSGASTAGPRTAAGHAGAGDSTTPAAAAGAKQEPQGDAAPDAVASSSAASGAVTSTSSGNGSKEVKSSSSGRRGSSSDQVPSLSPADLVRELHSMKTENLELVKMLAAQLQEVRAQNAELMAAFHRGGPSLAAVQEEADGSGTKGNGGTSTPNTGSELGTFKDRLRIPGLARAGSVTAGSDAGSSMRSAPVGMTSYTPTKSGSLWRWATGGRRVGGAMTADNMSVGDNVSIPDTLASPRSNISIPVETLVDLLDGWGAR